MSNRIQKFLRGKEREFKGEERMSHKERRKKNLKKREILKIEREKRELRKLRKRGNFVNTRAKNPRNFHLTFTNKRKIPKSQSVKQAKSKVQ